MSQHLVQRVIPGKAVADDLSARSVSLPSRSQQESAQGKEETESKNMSTLTDACDSGETFGMSNDECSVGFGRETGPESPSNVDNGVFAQADAPLSEQHQSPAIPASMSILEACGQVGRPVVVDSAPEAATAGRSPMEQNDILSSPICFTHRGLDDPRHVSSYPSYPSYPSPLSQQRSVNDQSDVTVSGFDGQGNENAHQHSVFSQPDQGATGCPSLSDVRNEAFSGRHPETYKRTRLVRLRDDTTLWKSGSSFCPASPIGRYPPPLSISIPATHPFPQCQPLTRTNSFITSSHPAPLLIASPLSTSLPVTQTSYTPTQATSHRQRDLEVILRKRTQFQPVTSSSTSPSLTRQVPANLCESAQRYLPFQVSAMEQRTKSDDLGNKKRSRMLHEASANPLISALATSPETFKVSAKSAFTSGDYESINVLIDAMNDMGSSEDNEGMIKSWNRLKMQKAAKVVSVCEDLLVAMKRKVALKGQSLSDHKKSSNHYPTFEARFNAVQETLKTQKTVCKHLLEDPYLYQVVDDPIYASMRVTNNRRVNKGKKDAIEQGRRLMGLKGNGKGHPLIKQDSSEIGEDHDDHDYEEEQDRYGTRRLRDRSQLKRSNYNEQESLRGSIEEDESPRPAKKPKRAIRPKRDIQIHDVDTISTSVITSDNLSEDLGNVKIEPGHLSPQGTSSEENDPNGPLPRPLDHYFGGMHGNTDNAPYPISRPFDMTYGAYPTTSYQTFDQPNHPAPQQFAPQHTIFPQHFNTARANLPNTLDGFNETQPYSSAWIDGFHPM